MDTSKRKSLGLLSPALAGLAIAVSVPAQAQQAPASEEVEEIVVQGIRASLRDSVAAVSVGIVNGRPVLDLNYEEDSRADVDMNVVLTGAGKFVELQATGEKASFDDPQLTEMISLARTGIARLRSLQLEAVGGKL